MVAAMDRRRLILLFLASAVFSLMVFFTLYALFVKDMNMGFMRQPDVAPDVQQQHTQATPSESDVGNNYDSGVTTQEQGSTTTQTTQGVTDMPPQSTLETPSKVMTPSAPAPVTSTVKKTNPPLTSAEEPVLRSPQAIKRPQSRPVQHRSVAYPAPPVPAEDPLAPPVPSSVE